MKPNTDIKIITNHKLLDYLGGPTVCTVSAGGSRPIRKLIFSKTGSDPGVVVGTLLLWVYIIIASPMA